MVSRGISVRPTVMGDLRSIQDLNYELFKSDNQWQGDLNEDWPYGKDGESYFRSSIEKEDKLCVVAEVAGKIVGYLCGGLVKPHSAYHGSRAELENMCVTDKYRNQGIGTALIDEFKKWSKANNIDKMIVVAFSGNDHAIEFYKANGFSEYAVKLWQDV